MQNTNLFLLTLALASLGSGCTKSTTNIELGSVGDTMAYDKTLLEVKAGAKVQLKLVNHATSPAMVHDFVLVKPGAEQKIGLEALAAGEAKGYLPESTDILAASKLVKPGESTTLEFTAPTTPGDYPYICTYPGHFAVMKGILRVSAS